MKRTTYCGFLGIETQLLCTNPAIGYATILNGSGHYDGRFVCTVHFRAYRKFIVGDLLPVEKTLRYTL